MTWFLFIISLCGQGCIEVTAREYESQEECLRYEIRSQSTIATCVREVRS